MFINPEYVGKDKPRLLMLDGGLDGFNYEDVQMQIQDPAQLQQIQQQEMQILSNVAHAIADECDVLMCRDGVHEAIAKYLEQNNVAVVRRLQQSDIDAVSRITGVLIYHRITEVEETPEFKGVCIT